MAVTSDLVWTKEICKASAAPSLQGSFRHLDLFRSELFAPSLDLVENELHVRVAGDGMRSVHHPEEVDEPLAGHGLVADHQGAVQDHLLLQYWRNLEKENIYFFNRYHQQQNKWYLHCFFLPISMIDIVLDYRILLSNNKRYCSRLSYLIEQ